jgi:hypothetical protein
VSKPIPDKAEVALEYPEKLYIGAFERSSRFEAHLDRTGISLTLERAGTAEARRSIRMHLHYGLFAEILLELAKTVAEMSADDADHRRALKEATKALHAALAAKPVERARKAIAMNPTRRNETDMSKMSPEEEVLLLHILE